MRAIFYRNGKTHNVTVRDNATVDQVARIIFNTDHHGVATFDNLSAFKVDHWHSRARTAIEAGTAYDAMHARDYLTIGDRIAKLFGRAFA